MTMKLEETFTHEVELGGKSAYSTQLPKGMDPVKYDEIIKQMDQHVGDESSAGRKGAEARFELAMRLKLDCPECADMNWRQLVQVPAYVDGISHINAKYGKAKSAYSNHLTELREDKDQLRKFFADRFPDLTPEDHQVLTDEWYLDPNREKSGGGKKKTSVVDQETGDLVQVTEPDDAQVDDSSTSLVGLMSATETRLNNEPVKDFPLDFLNQVNSLIRAAERAKSQFLTHLRSSGS